MTDGRGATTDGPELDLVVVERRAAASWARGATRRVRVTYGCQCGTLAGTEVVSVLNVAQDPDLAEELVSGALNRATCPACGVDHLLRMAVTVHDPAGRRVVICAGEGDRHRALDLLIQYLEGLRDQPGDSVPAYALSPEVSFGRSAWREQLSAPPRSSLQAAQTELAARRREIEDKTKGLEQSRAALAASQRDIETARAAIESQVRIVSDRAAGIEEREAELAKRERRLADAKGRADELEKKFREEQAECARLREELESLRSVLEDREAVLRHREEDLAAAEEQLGRREASLASSVAAAIQAAAGPLSSPAAAPVPAPALQAAPAPKAPASRPAEPAPAAAAKASAERPAAKVPEREALSKRLEPDEGEAPPAKPVRVTEADVLDERALEPDTEVSRAPAPPAKPAASPAAAPAPAPKPPTEEPMVEVRDSDLLPDAAAEEVEPEEIVDAEAEAEPASSGMIAPRLKAAPKAAPPPPPPSPSPIPESLRAWFSSGVPTFVAVEGGEVHLYRRPPPEETASMRRHLAPGCRLFLHEEVPWLELALADEEADPPELVDAWLVHFELVDDAAVVRMLAERFVVHVIEVDEAGHVRWTAELSAPLARNVVRIRQAAARLDAKKKGDRAAATAAACVDGAAWLDRTGMPDFGAEEAPATAGAIQQALVELTPWMAEEAEERLLVDRSVPGDVVDGYRKRVLSAAVKTGLWLPPDLARRAVQDGLAPSPERLVAQLTESFFRVTGRRHDLDREAVGRNWLYLTRDAERLGLMIDPGRLAWIQALLRDANLAEPAEGQTAGPETAKGDQELLLRWLSIGAARGPALAELLRGRLSDYVPELAVALDGIDGADLLDSLIELRANEDLAAELFMAGLDAHRRPLRIASATALGKLALRRAIVPLVHLLLRAESDDWRFVGAAIASYGATGAKAIEPMLADPRGKEDRLAWTLACFKGAAAERHVKALMDSNEILTSAIARRSADWRSDAESFREKLEAAEPAGAGTFVRLVRKILSDTEAQALHEAVAQFRAQGGMDI